MKFQCNFDLVQAHIEHEREIKKNRTKEEKLQEKERNAKIVEEYGFCMWDGHKEKIGNFR